MNKYEQTFRLTVTVSALLSLVRLLINCFYHLLHSNVTCFEQIKFDLNLTYRKKNETLSDIFV